MPPKPVNPLSTITIADVASASLDGAALAPGSPGFRLAAAMPARIAANRPAAKPIDWVDVKALRLVLRDGVVLWVQLMPDATGGWVRVTADAARPEAAARARAIRNLRLRAYHLPGAFPTLAGAKAESEGPTELSTRTK